MMSGLISPKAAEHLKALAISFSVVALGTAQFIRHARPSPDIITLTPAVTVTVVTLIILLPAVLLFLADRTLALRDQAGRRVRRLRTGAFAVALVLIVRQLYLYFDPVTGAIEPLTSHVALSVVAALTTVAGAVWAARRAYDQFSQFFLWMAFPALVMTAIVAYDITGVAPPSGYANETPVPSDEAPVFVLVFDELSYDVLADGSQIDAESYPNLAALAADGAWFTNASTNYFHTTFVIPKLFGGVTSLTDDYQVRLYSQYGYVESLLHDGCGSGYTCRGQAHLAAHGTGTMLGDVLVRGVYQAAPDFLDFALDPAMASVSGTALPSVDRLGIHTFTDEQWAEFIGDVGVDQSRGRLYFVHELLPHEPFIYDPEGQITTSGEDVTFYDPDADEESVYENYRRQAQHLDRLVGELLDQLQSQGLYGEATIVVTGDHGLRRHSLDSGLPIDITNEVSHVPLIVKSPRVAPQIVTVDYQHVDFGATLMDALGRETPAGQQGISAFASDRPDREKVLYVDEDNKRFWEYVYRPDDDRWELTREVEGPLPETPQFAIVSALGD